MSTSTEQSAAAEAPPGVTPPTATGGRSGFLSDVIVELGFATEETVEQAVRAARSPGTTVARVLVEMKAISEEQLARAAAERYGIAYIDLEAFEVDPAAANLIDLATARRYQAVPVGFVGERVLVAMADPADALALDNIAAMTERQAHPAVASRPALDALLEGLLLDQWQPNEDSAKRALAGEAVPEQPSVAPISEESTGASHLRAKLGALKSQLAGAEAKLEATRAKAESEAAEGPDVAGLQAKLADAEVELEGARARVREAKEVSAELETLREALAAAEAGLDARAHQGGDASADTHDLPARLADMKNERNAERERADSLKAERDDARERVRKLESELRRLRAEGEVRSGELDSLRKKLDSRGSEVEAMRRRAQST
jgi:Type II secretion system (T2SS), protein E, N-terminal domain